MKKHLLLLSFLLLSVAAKSQILIALLFGDKLNQNEKIEFGITGGFNLSTINGLAGAKSIIKPTLGFYFDIQMKEGPWFLHTGLFPVSTMGTSELPVYPTSNAALDELLVGGKVKRVFNYFSLPLFAKYKFKNSLYVEGGPQFGLMYNATDKFTNQIVNSKDLKFFNDVGDQYRNLDAGATLGLGYRLAKGNGINIGARYYWGLVNISKDASSPKQYNRSLYLVVGIPVGAGKSPKGD